MRIAELIAESEPQPTRTLYHGTCRALIPAILQYGLLPQVGEFTVDAYAGSYEEDEFKRFPQLVFAADKENTLHGCISAMGDAIQRHHGVERTASYQYPAIVRYGALCVIRNDNHKFQWNDGADDFDTDTYPQVEPGDYFSGHRVFPDYILTGKKLGWWLEKQRSRFEPWKRRHNPTSGPWESAKAHPAG